jgi:hypothetical protein
VQVGLHVIDSCLQRGHWREEYTWRCPQSLAAKAMYRSALCIRLWGEIKEAVQASAYIDRARTLAPNDPVILKGQQTIMRWAAGM